MRLAKVGLGLALIAAMTTTTWLAWAGPSCSGLAATIIGTERPDDIVGTQAADVIVGLAGDDQIDGRGGADVICAGDGFDFVQGGPGPNELNGGDGDDTLHGGPVGDLLRGQGGIDSLFGEGGADVLRGGPNVGLGIEGLIGGPGDDRLIGGPGLDSAQFFDSHRPIHGDLTTGLVTGIGDDRLAEVEGLVGSNLDDVLIGDDGGNGLFGQTGDDVIRGLGSGSLASGTYDVIAGDDGDDELDGGSGFDVATYGRAPVAVTLDLATGSADGHGHDVLRDIEGAFGSVLDDVLVGDRMANAFAGSLGDDRIIGRGGGDIAVYSDLRGPVQVDLGSGVASGAGSDSLAGIERVWGTDAADVIIGDDDDNVLVGFDGDDEISGSGGNDRLVGGRGADTLDGGDGVDTCLSGAVTSGCETPLAATSLLRSRVTDRHPAGEVRRLPDVTVPR